MARSAQGTRVMSDARNADLPDLVVGVIDDARNLVEAQVSSIKTELGARLVDLGAAIKSWLVAVCVAIVTTALLGISLAATITELAGVPWYLSLWIVTAVAVLAVVGLVYRARVQGRHATATAAALALEDNHDN